MLSIPRAEDPAFAIKSPEANKSLPGFVFHEKVRCRFASGLYLCGGEVERLGVSLGGAVVTEDAHTGFGERVERSGAPHCWPVR